MTTEWSVEEALPPGFAARLASLGSDAPPSAYQAAFNELVLQLKYTPRTGWVDRGVPHPESIADHMYRMAIMAWQVPVAPGVDRGVAIRTALAHDIAEAIVGDLTPYCGISADEKHDRERRALVYLADLARKFSSQFADELETFWNDYEQARTPEAKLIKDIDKVELWDQTKAYEREHRDIDFSSFDGLQERIVGEEVREVARGVDMWHQTAPTVGSGPAKVATEGSAKASAPAPNSAQ